MSSWKYFRSIQSKGITKKYCKSRKYDKNVLMYTVYSTRFVTKLNAFRMYAWKYEYRKKNVSEIANSSHLKINFGLHFGLSHFGWFIHLTSDSIKFALHIRHLDAFLIELFQHTQKSIPFHQLIRNEIPQREKMKVNKVTWTGKLQVNLIYLQIDDFRCVHWLTLKVNGIYWNELGWNQTERKIINESDGAFE